jgi:hypothetical protein
MMGVDGGGTDLWTVCRIRVEKRGCKSDSLSLCVVIYRMKVLYLTTQTHTVFLMEE